MLEMLETRKSMRRFLDQEVEEEKKRQILEVALRAPTAGNMSLYSVIEIERDELKEKLSVSCDHQPFIAETPFLLLFVADYSRWYALFKEKDPSCRKPSHGDLFLAACDALIAAQTAVIAADALGLGSCYIGDILEEAQFHRDLFGLPPYTMPITLLCIGYPTEQQRQRAQPPRFALEALHHKDIYTPRSLEELKADLEKKDPRRGAQAQIDDLFHRKWTSAFLKEMDRSVKEWLEWWR